MSDLRYAEGVRERLMNRAQEDTMTQYQKRTMSPEEFLREGMFDKYGEYWEEVNLYNAEIEDFEKNAVGEYYTATVSLHRNSRIEIQEPVNEFKVGQVYEFEGRRRVITRAPNEAGFFAFSPLIGDGSFSARVNSDLAKRMKLVLDVED